MKLLAIAAGTVMALLIAGCEVSPDPSSVDIPTNKKFVVYDFWAPWCGPCREYGPVFEKLKKKYTRENVTFKRINVDEDKKTAERFNIDPIPTVVVTADDKEVGRFVGGMGEKQLLKVLK